MFHSLLRHLRSDQVLLLSAALAGLSCCFAPSSAQPLQAIDLQTLSILFVLMLIYAGLGHEGLVQRAAKLVLRGVHTRRKFLLRLTALAFGAGMLVTNDVALITLVPFALTLIRARALESETIQTVVLMTLAANLGSMLTPIGNPQNLYLYSRFSLALPDFILTMLPVTLLSALLLLLAIGIRCLRNRVEIPAQPTAPAPTLNRFRTSLLGLLFLTTLACLSGLLSPLLLVLLACTVFLYLDRRAFAEVDYALLLTFVCWFVLVENLQAFDSIRTLLSQITQGQERWVSILLSQCISNVPTAVLLAPYAQNPTDLLIGCNLGGLGTLIASMASLISYKALVRHDPQLKSRYLLQFSAYNLVFLCLLAVGLHWIQP